LRQTHPSHIELPLPIAGAKHLDGTKASTTMNGVAPRLQPE
jgi:hypothetical protein